MAEGVGFEPSIRFPVRFSRPCWQSERLRRPVGVALEGRCDVFDDLFRGHFSER